MVKKINYIYTHIDNKLIDSCMEIMKKGETVFNENDTATTKISTKDILDCIDIRPDSEQNENTFKNQIINYDEFYNFFELDEETKKAFKNRDILKRNM